jgi:hypothetical protein
MGKTKKTDRIFGKLIVDLTNAKTYQEAYHKLFLNMQEALSFSDQFAKKAKTFLPPPLEKHEKTLCKLLLKESDTRDAVDRHLLGLSLALKGYDPQKQTLTVSHFDLPEDSTNFDEAVYGENFEVHINQEPIYLIEISGSKMIKLLMRIGQKILEKKNSLPSGRFSQLKSISQFKMVFFYNKMPFSLYEHISKTQEELTQLLENVLNVTNLSDSKIFNDYLLTYNKVKSELVAQGNGQIIEKSRFVEDNFLKRNLFPQCDPYKEIMAYCAVEFLKHPANKKLIHQCDQCKNFYISKTIRTSKFCSDRCRLAWHNRKRIESGKAKEYKRRKRAEGAKESYYG